MTSPKPLSTLQPGDTLPPPPANYPLKLVIGRSRKLELLHVEDQSNSPTSFHLRCSPQGRAESVSVNRGDGRYQAPDHPSPTDLYRLGKSELAWHGRDIPPGYSALCRETREMVRRNLRPFEEGVRGRKALSRPLGSHLMGGAGEVFADLVSEYRFSHGSDSPKLHRTPIDEMATVFYPSDGGRYYGVDLDGNGHLDIVRADIVEGGLKMLLYDTEASPQLIPLPPPQAPLSGVERKGATINVCSLRTEQRGLYVNHPDQPACPTGPGTLCLPPEPAGIGIEFDCWTSSPLARITTTRNRGFTSVPLPTLPNRERWLGDGWDRPDRREAIWFNPREGVVRFRLESVSDSGKKRLHAFEIMMTWDGTSIRFQIPRSFSKKNTPW